MTTDHEPTSRPAPTAERTLPAAALIAPALIALALVTAACGLVPERSPGEKLWRKYCTECHGLQGNGNTPRYMGKPYADLIDDTWRVGGDEYSLAESIRSGFFGEMPAFDHLSDKEIGTLVTYVRELRGEAVPGSTR